MYQITTNGSRRARALTIVGLALGAGVPAAGGAGADISPAASGEPVTVDFLIPDTSSNIVDPGFAVITPEFTERTGTTVNWVNSGGPYGAVEQAILAGSIAGDLPDAAIISSASVRTYVDAGLAQPFDPLMDADASFDAATTEPSMLSFGDFDGQTFGLPLTASWVVMYYNVEVFEAAGLDPDDPPETFSELEAAARQIVESGAAPHGFAFRFADDPNMWRLQNVLSSAGGSLMSADGTELTFDDPVLVDIVSFLGEMASDDIIGLYDAPSIRDAFFRGDIGMTFDASSGARAIGESAAFEYRIAPYPIPDGGSRILSAGGASVVMFTDDPARQQGVWEAVRELVGPAGGVAYLEEQGGGVLVLDAAANEEYADAHAELALTAEDIEALAPMAQFPGSSAQEIWSILTDELLAVMQSGKDATEALADSQEAAESLLP